MYVCVYTHREKKREGERDIRTRTQSAYKIEHKASKFKVI